MPKSSFTLAYLPQVCFRTRFPCYFTNIFCRQVSYNFCRYKTAFQKQGLLKLVSVAPYRGYSTTATPISPETYYPTISLNDIVETYFSLETIGNSPAKTLRPEATQKNKPSKNRLGVMSSFSSGSKRNTPKNNGNVDQGVEMEIEKVDLKEAAPHAKEIPTDEVPKLERQLTSNFDKEVDFSDSEFNDLDTLERDNIVSHVEEPDPQGHVSMENINVGDSEKKTIREMNLNLYTGEATDIGGGHENQDKAMCFRAGKNDEHLVMAVFDGHGRELGELAATIARDFMKKELKKTEVLKRIQDNPTSTLEEIFLEAHLRIKTKFKEQVQKIGSWTVIEADEGYLIKRQKVLRKSPTPSVQDTYHIAETNVHGGTTATVVIILNNRRLIVANVGDSTALFGGIDESDNVVFKELSAEHSPESIDEYLRVYESISTTIPSLPGSNSSVLVKGTVTSTSQILRFVYDVIDRYPSTTPKHSCPPIFFVNDPPSNGEKQNNGSLQVRRSPNGGFYYKNVRSEWATLVTTPPTARFQDALAFTRSLGDLHLHVYGVTHVPEVREYDLSLLHGSLGRKEKSSVILVCTDGVWDNWRYSDIIRKVMNSSLIEKSVVERSSQELTDELMRENIRLAKTHFGNQADNMTGIVCLVHNNNTDDSK